MTARIQYKGTNICLDFDCPVCGEYSHFDGYGAYVIECPHCTSLFELSDVNIRQVTKETQTYDGWEPLKTEKYDD